MLTFGFSAYLKLVCLNDKPQVSEVKKRVSPSGKPYDFHRSFRLISRKMLLESVPIDEIADAIQNIKREPERNSAKKAIKEIIAWRKASKAMELFKAPSMIYESPGSMFQVRFDPDFAAHIDGRKTAIHLWNTQKPQLQRTFVLSSLALMAGKYKSEEDGVDDIAVYSLVDHQMYRLGDEAERRRALEVGTAVASAIERLIRRVSGDLGISIGPRPLSPPLAPIG
jgi:hypothetical protein